MRDKRMRKERDKLLDREIYENKSYTQKITLIDEQMTGVR